MRGGGGNTTNKATSGVNKRVLPEEEIVEKRFEFRKNGNKSDAKMKKTKEAVYIYTLSGIFWTESKLDEVGECVGDKTERDASRTRTCQRI